MVELKCPNCGAPVRLVTSSSVAAVCKYCDSTLARDDAAGRDALKNLGKISSLVEDASPLCLEAEGEFSGKRFEVVGRLQLEYEDGFWNEWFLHFHDRSTGWLGEALGQYFVTQEGARERVPPYDNVRVGSRLAIAGSTWTVADKRRAKCAGGEGELPSIVGKGYDYELAYADLRAPGNAFATIDWSEDPPLVFVGKCLSWDELHMKKFRRFHGWS
jgi:hypothetical protein